MPARLLKSAQSTAELDELAQVLDLVQGMIRSIDGTIRFWNHGAEQMYGWSRAEAVGRVSHQLLATEFPEPLHEITAKLLRDGSWTGELTHKTRDGRRLCVISYWALHRDADGRAKSVIEVSNDITALKRVEVALRNSNQDLKHFAYAVAHDIQAPVRTITSFAELVLKKHGDDPETVDFLGYVLDASARMQSMLTDLMGLTRLFAEESQAPEFVDIAEALCTAKRDLAVAIDESGAIITHDELPVITGEHIQIVRILENLIANAIKYRREARARIHISAVEQERDWLFCVSDNGEGFDPAYADRIFGIFQRLHGSEYPGSGLGLAICRKIVERHGGRIWAESEPGVGSRFWFTLAKKL